MDNKIELTEKRINSLLLVEKYLNNIALNSPTKKAQGQITKDRIKLIERDLIIYKNQMKMIWNQINIFLNLPTVPKKINFNWSCNSIDQSK